MQSDTAPSDASTVASFGNFPLSRLLSQRQRRPEGRRIQTIPDFRLSRTHATR